MQIDYVFWARLFAVFAIGLVAGLMLGTCGEPLELHR